MLKINFTAIVRSAQRQGRKNTSINFKGQSKTCTKSNTYKYRTQNSKLKTRNFIQNNTKRCNLNSNNNIIILNKLKENIKQIYSQHNPWIMTRKLKNGYSNAGINLHIINLLLQKTLFVVFITEVKNRFRLTTNIYRLLFLSKDACWIIN